MSLLLSPFAQLTMFKAGLAATYFIVTLLSGMSAYKMLISWRGKKQESIRVASGFTAGVMAGLTTIEFLIRSHHALRSCEYPPPFLIYTVGYHLAMLVDYYLKDAVSRLTRESFTSSSPKFLDQVMLGFVSDLQPTKYQDTALPKDCDDISYLRNHILSRARVVGHVFFLTLTFSMLYVHNWLNIGRAQTKNMISIALHNITYAVSLAFAVQSMPLIGCLHVITFSGMVPIGIILECILWDIDSISGTGPSGLFLEAEMGIYMAFSAGVMVYFWAHHMLFNGNEPINSKTRLRKYVAATFGVCVIAMLMALDPGNVS